jgi:hypothetical protein
VLADEMQLPAKKAHGLEMHYYRLLAAIFDVVADFFSDPSLGIPFRDLRGVIARRFQGAGKYERTKLKFHC